MTTKKKKRGDCHYIVWKRQQGGWERVGHTFKTASEARKKARALVKKFGSGTNLVEIDQVCHFRDGRGFGRKAFICDRRKCIATRGASKKAINDIMRRGSAKRDPAGAGVPRGVQVRGVLSGAEPGGG